ncbi:unnamed protein product [Rotaria magnacalcarata]|uniref:Uncharacterized protein n=1 Tax=Rotaria magnacalcarata TaxID=392030 RepID=A0A820KRU9_9BILA|nr:unnamed protein product [Rotaria magnacalcarata]CAF4177686.1 unnamed protein product [Rotaria magnacalcarata]CAF4347017.1 unnamed protein product [Rotaria magnacalcarata]
MSRGYLLIIFLASILVVFSIGIPVDEQPKGSCSQTEKVCRWFGGGDLCNNRCQQCGYKRGACGGFGWQTCQCL